MAKNLLDGGYDVVGHNRSGEPVNELIKYGGKDGNSPAEVAERSDIVITCLLESDHVRRVVLGDDEETDPVIDGVREDMTIIDTSTISPTVTECIAEELKAVGANMLDAPISGGEEGAIEGTLSIMVGGNADILDKYRDVFKVLGSTVTHCGPIGAG